MLGIYVFFLFLRALPGQADSEGLATSLQVYEKAADSLRAEIGEMVSGTKDFSGGFMASVKRCNPPYFDRILKGFADPTNPESAQSALSSSLERVRKVVGKAEMEMAAAVKTCNGESRTKIDFVAKAAKAALLQELSEYKATIDKARNDNQKMLISILQIRDRSPALAEKSAGPGDVTACSEAVQKLQSMDAANAKLQSSLGDLAVSFDKRLGETLAELDRSGRCETVPLIKASFSSEDRDASPLPEEGESGTAI